MLFELLTGLFLAKDIIKERPSKEELKPVEPIDEKLLRNRKLMREEEMEYDNKTIQIFIRSGRYYLPDYPEGIQIDYKEKYERHCKECGYDLAQQWAREGMYTKDRDENGNIISYGLSFSKAVPITNLRQTEWDDECFWGEFEGHDYLFTKKVVAYVEQ